MRRKDLEHLIRAAAAITDQYEIIIGHSDLSDLINGAIGELSPFEDRFGYYAHGVGPETAVLPEGWKSRLVRIQNKNTDLKTGYCLDPHDLAASKLVAGREKDREFVEILLEHKIVRADTLLNRIALLPIASTQKALLTRWVSESDERPAQWRSPA